VGSILVEVVVLVEVVEVRVVAVVRVEVVEVRVVAVVRSTYLPCRRPVLVVEVQRVEAAVPPVSSPVSPAGSASRRVRSVARRP